MPIGLKSLRRAEWLAIAAGAFVGIAAVVLGILAWELTHNGDGESVGAPEAGLEPLDARTVAQGRGIYQANCAVCHGTEAEGAPNWQVPNADGTYPPPPHNSSGHTWHHGDGLLFRIVRDGPKAYEGLGVKTVMPAFGDRLSNEDIRAVLTYLKSLWGSREREFQAQVSSDNPFPP